MANKLMGLVTFVKKGDGEYSVDYDESLGEYGCIEEIKGVLEGNLTKRLDGVTHKFVRDSLQEKMFCYALVDMFMEAYGVATEQIATLEVIYYGKRLKIIVGLVDDKVSYNVMYE